MSSTSVEPHTSAPTTSAPSDGQLLYGMPMNYFEGQTPPHKTTMPLMPSNTNAMLLFSHTLEPITPYLLWFLRTGSMIWQLSHNTGLDRRTSHPILLVVTDGSRLWMPFRITCTGNPTYRTSPNNSVGLP